MVNSKWFWDVVSEPVRRQYDIGNVVLTSYKSGNDVVCSQWFCDLCVCVYVFLEICIMCLFIYLNLCIGRVVGGPIPLTNIWRKLDM